MPPAPSKVGLSLSAYLKLLTSSKSLTMSEAMSVAAKLLPAGYNTFDRLSLLTASDLTELGFDENVRKGILLLTGRVKGKGKGGEGKGQATGGKRKFGGSDMDLPLPNKAAREVVQGDLDFEEINVPEALLGKKVVINRSPVMSAWAVVVAERLGFSRQEALSIANVYTELNATSKGVSLGIMGSEALQPGASSAQPHVDIMGRKVPVMKMQNGEWRAISKGQVVEPTVCFSYLQRSFRQQLGAVIGVMRVLAESFEPDDVNLKGYGLYCEFRPEAGGALGWGKKAEMKLSTLLDLRPAPKEEEEELGDVVDEEEEVAVVKVKDKDGGRSLAGEEKGGERVKSEEEEKAEEPSKKRPKLELEEDFDAFLDDDLDVSQVE